MYRDDFPRELAERWKVSRYAPDQDAISDAAAREIGLDWGVIRWTSDWHDGAVQIGSWVSRIAGRLAREIECVVRAGKQDDYRVVEIAEGLLEGLSPGQHFDLLVALNVERLPAREETSAADSAERTMDFTKIELVRRLNALLKTFEKDGLLLSSKERRAKAAQQRRRDRRPA